MKKIIKYIKKIIIGCLLLYAYNLIASTFNLVIPINFFTILIVGLFDIPALFCLVIIKLIGL